jgi:hypothetical protein
MTATNKAASPREELARTFYPEEWKVFDECGQDLNHPYLDQKVVIKARIALSLSRADEWLSRHPVKAASPEREASHAITKAAAKVERYLNARDFMGVETDFIDDQESGASDGDPVVDLWASDLHTLIAALSLPVQSVEAEPVAIDLRPVIHKALSRYSMTNMGDGDGNGYPLVDLMSSPGPATIQTGLDEMELLADHIAAAITNAAPPKPSEAPAMGWRPVDEMADLREVVGRMPTDLPNYASWPIELPAGHWRALAAASTPETATTKAGSASQPITATSTPMEG